METMDPNAAMVLFLSLVADGDYENAADIGAGLLEWMERGGFFPDELNSAVEDIKSARDDFFCFDDTGDDSDYIEFRLYIRPEGSVEVCTGAPDYDIDHRGFCGAGSVSSGAKLKDIRAAAADCFSDCVNSVSQSA